MIKSLHKIILRVDLTNSWNMDSYTSSFALVGHDVKPAKVVK